jgi:hypothetical protein
LRAIRSFSVDDADVGNRLALGHRRHRPDVQHDPCLRRSRVQECLAEVIGDVADEHPLLDVRAALDARVEHARLVAGDARDPLHPHRVLDDSGDAGNHPEIAHHVQAAVDEQVDVVGLHRAGVARLGGERSLAARARGVLQVPGLRRVLGTVGGDDDGVEAEGQDHVARHLVLLLVAGDVQ